MEIPITRPVMSKVSFFVAQIIRLDVCNVEIKSTVHVSACETISEIATDIDIMLGIMIGIIR